MDAYLEVECISINCGASSLVEVSKVARNKFWEYGKNLDLKSGLSDAGLCRVYFISKSLYLVDNECEKFILNERNLLQLNASTRHPACMARQDGGDYKFRRCSIAPLQSIRNEGVSHCLIF